MAALADVVALPGAAADPVPVPRSALVGTRALGRTVTRTNRLLNSAVESIAGAASDGVRAATRRLTDEPAGATDDWGRDPVLVRNMMLIAQLRWDVATGGDQHLPGRSGALIVVNAPRMSYSAVFAAFAISEAVDRPVRFVGRRESPISEALERRLGGLLDAPDEVAGALRANEFVVMGARPARGTRNVGVVDHAHVGAALATGTRVFPAASSSSLFGRGARVEIGPPVDPPRKRRGPLSELELADKIRDEIGGLLAEMGDIGTGTLFDWLPLSGMGAH